MTIEETKQLLARIAEFWPGRTATVTAATVDAWATLFVDIPTDTVTAALESYVDDPSVNQHPPSGPVLRGMAKAIKPEKYPTIYDENQGGFYVAPDRRRQLQERWQTQQEIGQ